MKRLWAGWRMQYVQDTAAVKGEGCLFCRLAALTPGPENLVLERSEETLIVMNAFPYNCGHMMVAPLRHRGFLNSVSAAEQAALLGAGPTTSINPRPGGEGPSPRTQQGMAWNSGYLVQGRVDEVNKVWYGAMQIPFGAIDTRPPQVNRTLRIGLFRIAGVDPARKFYAWQPPGQKGEPLGPQQSSARQTRRANPPARARWRSKQQNQKDDLFS